MKFRANMSFVYFLDVGHRFAFDLESLPGESPEKFQIRSGFPEFELVLTELIKQNDPALIARALNDALSSDKHHPAGTVDIEDIRLHSFLPFRTY